MCMCICITYACHSQSIGQGLQTIRVAEALGLARWQVDKIYGMFRKCDRPHPVRFYFVATVSGTVHVGNELVGSVVSGRRIVSDRFQPDSTGLSRCQLKYVQSMSSCELAIRCVMLVMVHYFCHCNIAVNAHGVVGWSFFAGVRNRRRILWIDGLPTRLVWRVSDCCSTHTHLSYCPLSNAFVHVSLLRADWPTTHASSPT
jgi:hypothetical protein